MSEAGSGRVYIVDRGTAMLGNSMLQPHVAKPSSSGEGHRDGPTFLRCECGCWQCLREVATLVFSA